MDLLESKENNLTDSLEEGDDRDSMETPTAQFVVQCEKSEKLEDLLPLDQKQRDKVDKLIEKEHPLKHTPY